MNAFNYKGSEINEDSFKSKMESLFNPHEYNLDYNSKNDEYQLKRAIMSKSLYERNNKK